jgi:hypothetical protein
VGPNLARVQGFNDSNAVLCNLIALLLCVANALPFPRTQVAKPEKGAPAVRRVSCARTRLGCGDIFLLDILCVENKCLTIFRFVGLTLVSMRNWE